MPHTKENWDQNLKTFFKDHKLKIKDFNKYKTALIHRSYSPNNNYEKYEFLGDRIINLVAAHAIFYNIKRNVKVLENFYKDLVSNKSLVDIGIEVLGLHQLILVGEGTELTERIVADCVEAIVGAIYDDLGFEAAFKFVDKYIIDPNW